MNSKKLKNCINGALFDFMGYLTTQEDFQVGQTHHPEKILDRYNSWCKQRNINFNGAAVNNWIIEVRKREKLDRI